MHFLIANILFLLHSEQHSLFRTHRLTSQSPSLYVQWLISSSTMLFKSLPLITVLLKGTLMASSLLQLTSTEVSEHRRPLKHLTFIGCLSVFTLSDTSKTKQKAHGQYPPNKRQIARAKQQTNLTIFI